MISYDVNYDAAVITITCHQYIFFEQLFNKSILQYALQWLNDRLLKMLTFNEFQFSTDFVYVCSVYLHALETTLDVTRQFISMWFEHISMPSSGLLTLSFCLPACLSACLSVCLPACLSVCLSVCLPDCLPASLSVCLSVCLSACLTACLPVCLSACLSVCLYIPSYSRQFRMYRADLLYAGGWGWFVYYNKLKIPSALGTLRRNLYICLFTFRNSEQRSLVQLVATVCVFSRTLPYQTLTG